ncbi:MAG: hypothetical protein ACLT3I_04540 [Ruminococcus sp.]
MQQRKPPADSTAYKAVLAAKRTQSRMGVPNDGRRWLIASPEFMEVLLADDLHPAGRAIRNWCSLA